MNTIERNKIRSYIGFAIKSGSVVYGADMITLCRKSPHLIIISHSINRTSDKNIREYADKRSVKTITLEDDIMKDIITRTNCKAIAITDKNLARAVIENFGVSVNEQK